MLRILDSLSDLALCQELISCFAAEIPKHDIPGANQVWTEKVKSSFDRFASNRGLRAQYTGAPSAALKNEYLCDIIVWAPDSWQVALVAESEWSNRSHELRKDFRKLMLVKAPLKIFVCDLGDDPQLRAKAECEAVLREYQDHLPGERYLVMNLCGNPRTGGSVRAYSWKVPLDGATEAPMLTSLGPPMDFHLA